MIQGEQLYLEANIKSNGKPINLTNISKIFFDFENITKVYDGSEEEVIYEDGIFKILLKQKDTLQFKDYIKMQVSVLYNDDTLLKSQISYINIFDAIIKEVRP